MLLVCPEVVVFPDLQDPLDLLELEVLLEIPV